MQNKIIIVGEGVVANATFEYLKSLEKINNIDESNIEITLYKNLPYNDKNAIKCFFSDSTECVNYVILCLPTFFNKKQNKHDCSQIITAIDHIRSINDRDIRIVIKSTVMYEHIEDIINDDILINPEFLSANSAFIDVMQQEHILIGCNNHKNAHDLAEIYTLANECNGFYKPTIHYVTPQIACEFKHIKNIYGAYEVLFTNFVQETTDNYRKHMELLKIFSDPNVYRIFAADGKKGFGGKCFPKDVASFDAERPNELTNFILNYNKQLRGETF